MTHLAIRVSALALVAVAIGATACSEEVIVLATLPSTLGPSASGVRCVSSSECDEGLFCDHESCTSPVGTCEPYPVSCDEDEHPVCGCDGITYFNNCLRRAAGATGATEEECGGGGTYCGGSSAAECPAGSTCALLGSTGVHGCGATDAPPIGRCWVLPSTCPHHGSRADRWNACDEDLRCVDTCTAIVSGKAFVRASRCM